MAVLLSGCAVNDGNAMERVKHSIKAHRKHFYYLNIYIFICYFIEIFFPDIIDCSENTCGGRGECIELIGGFQCVCEGFFSGETCQIGIVLIRVRQSSCPVNKTLPVILQMYKFGLS